MSKIETWNVVHVPTESNWGVRFSQNADGVHIGLHWGDKDEPTHETQISTAEFKKIVSRMLEDFE